MERNRNGNLPDELINEILLRLPVKTLLVCKCVCKAWCGLIRSSSFIKHHFSHESNQERLLIRKHTPFKPRECRYVIKMYEDVDSRSRVDYINHVSQLPTQDGARDLMGPVNGVFCVVSNCLFIGLLNPAIREFKTLPPHPLHDPSKFCENPHPPRSGYVGFGLDPCSGDFMVVAFERSSDTSFAFVYRLSSDSWNRIDSVEALDLFAPLDEYSFNPRILNGVNYWLIQFADRDVPSVVGFDMGTEKFQEISIPDGVRITTSFLDVRITEYGESIALMSCKQEERLDLWVMGGDGLWSKSFSIDPFKECTRSLCVWKKNMVFFEASSTPLKMYDIPTQKITTLIPENLPGFAYDHFIYKESLVSIKGERADCDFEY